MSLTEDKKIENQKTTLGINPEDVSRTVPTERGAFVIKALLPYEKANVIRVVSNMIGSDTGLMPGESDFIRRTAILDVCITSKPDWFDKASLCYDESLLAFLYEQYNDLTDKLNQKLKKNHGSTN